MTWLMDTPWPNSLVKLIATDLELSPYYVDYPSMVNFNIGDRCVSAPLSSPWPWTVSVGTLSVLLRTGFHYNPTMNGLCPWSLTQMSLPLPLSATYLNVHLSDLRVQGHPLASSCRIWPRVSPPLNLETWLMGLNCVLFRVFRHYSWTTSLVWGLSCSFCLIWLLWSLTPPSQGFCQREYVSRELIRWKIDISEGVPNPSCSHLLNIFS